MNKEEASEKLERYLECQSNDCNLECDNCELFEGLLDEHEGAIRVVIQELKKLSIKEIPKKIKKQAYMETTCNCGHVFSKHHGDGYYSIPYENMTAYCPDCGQKLDWGKEEWD
jgi:hypothetical protein